MRRFTVTGILALALLLPLAAQAQDEEGKKGNDDLFLGRNLLLQVIVESKDFTHTVELMSASDYFKVQREVEGWRIWARGWLKPVRDAYLIQTDITVNPAGVSSSKTKRPDGEFQVSASALLAVGEELTIGRSGDLVVKLKVTEVR